MNSFRIFENNPSTLKSELPSQVNCNTSDKGPTKEVVFYIFFLLWPLPLVTSHSPVDRKNVSVTLLC